MTSLTMGAAPVRGGAWAGGSAMVFGLVVAMALRSGFRVAQAWVLPRILTGGRHG